MRFWGAHRPRRKSSFSRRPDRRFNGSHRHYRRMETIELALVLFVAVAILGAIAKWIPLPLPIILTAGGAVLSFVPGLTSVRLDPDIFFLLFVPPLLFSDGW